jgi:uncharacterized repeat protein (TIGR03803 family)
LTVLVDAEGLRIPRAARDDNWVGVWLMDEEESMKCNKSFCQGAALLLIAITVMLAPGAMAQSKYKTLYRFTGGADGRWPAAGLIRDQAGNLYGTTLGGGAHIQGTAFKLAPNSDGSWTESVLYSFCSPQHATTAQDRWPA